MGSNEPVTQNTEQYNVKLIVYSLVISFQNPAKETLKYLEKYDPLNEYCLKNVANMLYRFSLLYPIALVWDLYEKFTPLKIILLIY